MKRALIRRRPSFFADPFFRGMDQFFNEEILAPFGGKGESTISSSWMPAVDVQETEDSYVFTAELPGLEESDFSVSIEDGVLTLEGEKKSRLEAGSDEEQGRPGYRRVETRWGHFARRLRFGVEIDEDAVSATYKNGVLEIVVPKAPESSRARTIPVTTA